MEKFSQTVLVTGASGFIGSHVCRHLITSGYRVRALVRGSQSLGLDSHASLEYLSGDLQKPASLIAACDSVDIVVHLAGIAHANNISEKSLFDINTVGTKSLLNAAISQNVKKFVYLSSTLAETLDDRGHPTTAYGTSKLKAEKLLLEAHNASSINALVLRPANVYGPGMRGNISTLISLISSGYIPLLPLLNTRISLIGINDVSRAIKLAMESSYSGGKAYTLTDGETYIISDLEFEIYEALDKTRPRWRCPRIVLYLGLFLTGVFVKTLNIFGLDIPSIAGVSLRTYKNLITDNLFDNSEACKNLGFEPSETFYTLLPKCVSGYK